MLGRYICDSWGDTGHVNYVAALAQSVLLTSSSEFVSHPLFCLIPHPLSCQLSFVISILISTLFLSTLFSTIRLTFGYCNFVQDELVQSVGLGVISGLFQFSKMKTTKFSQFIDSKNRGTKLSGMVGIIFASNGFKNHLSAAITKKNKESINLTTFTN